VYVLKSTQVFPRLSLKTGCKAIYALQPVLILYHKFLLSQQDELLAIIAIFQIKLQYLKKVQSYLNILNSLKTYCEL